MRIRGFRVLLGLLCSSAATAQQPSWHWGRGLTGAQNDRFTDVETDAVGNVYVTGSLVSDSVWLGQALVVRPAGASVASFVGMYDYTGISLWAAAITGPPLDLWRSMSGEVLGSIVHSGDFGPAGSIISSPTAYSYSLWNIGSSGAISLVLGVPDIIPLSTNAVAPVALEDTVHGLTLIGVYLDSALVGDTVLYASTLGRYVARFASDGSLLWASRFIEQNTASESLSVVTDHKVDESGDVHLTGALSWFGTVCDSLPNFMSASAGWYASISKGGDIKRVLFPPVDVVYEVNAFDVRPNGNLVWGWLHGGNNDWDVVIEEMDTLGTIVWSLEEHGLSMSSISNIEILSDGSVLALGSGAGLSLDHCASAEFVGSPGLFVYKVDAAGTCEWLALDDDATINTWSTHMAVLNDGTQYVLGLLDGWGVFGVDTLLPSPSPASFVAKLSSTALLVNNDVVVPPLLSPNPFSEFVQLTSVPSGPVKVFDASGQLHVELANLRSATLDLSGLAPGLYLVSWDGHMERVIKE